MPRYSKLFVLTSALTLSVVGSVALFATMQNFSLYMALLKGQFYTPIVNSTETLFDRAFGRMGLFSAETGLVATYRFRYLANGGNLCDLYPVAF